MPSTVTLTLESKVTVIKTYTGVFISGQDNTVTTDGLNETLNLTASTTPPVTKSTSFRQAMTGGAATIDLTALSGDAADETTDLTGLKVQALKLRNKSTNANKITVSNGASNGYKLDGATAWSIPLAPGQSVLFSLNDAADDVAPTTCTIDLAGTLAQELEVEIVAG